MSTTKSSLSGGIASGDIISSAGTLGDGQIEGGGIISPKWPEDASVSPEGNVDAHDGDGDAQTPEAAATEWVPDFEPGPEFIYDPEQAKEEFEIQEREDRALERGKREEQEKRGLRKQFGANVDLSAVSYDNTRFPGNGSLLSDSMSNMGSFAQSMHPNLTAVGAAASYGGFQRGGHSITSSTNLPTGIVARHNHNDGSAPDRPIKLTNIFASPQVIAFRVPRIPANTDLYLQLDLGKEATSLLISAPAFEPEFNGFGPTPQRLKDAALLRMYMSDYFTPRSTDYRWQEEFKMTDRAAVTGSTATGTGGGGAGGGGGGAGAGADDDDDDDSAGPKQSRYLKQKRAAAHKSFHLPYGTVLGHTGDVESYLAAVPVLGISNIKDVFYFSLFSSMALSNIEIYCRVNQRTLRPEDDVRHPWRISRMRTVNSFSHDAFLKWFEQNRTKLTLGTAALLEPNTGMNPLHIICGHLSDVRLARLMLKNCGKYIKLNHQDEELQTPIFKLVRRADIYNRHHPLHFRALDLLKLVAFEGGCSLDLQDKQGNTVVHYAARYHTVGSGILPKLLEFGAPPDTRNVEGRTPAEEAELFGGGRCPVTGVVIPHKLPLDLRDVRQLLEAANVALNAARADERAIAASVEGGGEGGCSSHENSMSLGRSQSTSRFLEALDGVRSGSISEVSTTQQQRLNARANNRRSFANFSSQQQGPTQHVYYNQKGQKKTIHGLPSSILEAKRKREKAQRQAERRRRKEQRRAATEAAGEDEERTGVLAHEADSPTDSSADEAPDKSTAWNVAKQDAYAARQALKAEERASRVVAGFSENAFIVGENSVSTGEEGTLLPSSMSRRERIGEKIRRMSLLDDASSNLLPPSSSVDENNNPTPSRRGRALSIATDGDGDDAFEGNNDEENVVAKEDVEYDTTNPADPTNVPSGHMRSLNITDPHTRGLLRVQCGKPQLLDAGSTLGGGGESGGMVGAGGGGFPRTVIRQSKVSGVPKLRGTHTKSIAAQHTPHHQSSPHHHKISSLDLPSTPNNNEGGGGFHSEEEAMSVSSHKRHEAVPESRHAKYLAHAGAISAATKNNSLTSTPSITLKNNNNEGHTRQKSILKIGGTDSDKDDSEDGSSDAEQADDVRMANAYSTFKSEITKDAANSENKKKAAEYRRRQQMRRACGNTLSDTEDANSNNYGLGGGGGSCSDDDIDLSPHRHQHPHHHQNDGDEEDGEPMGKAEVQSELVRAGMMAKNRLTFSEGESRDYQSYVDKAGSRPLTNNNNNSSTTTVPLTNTTTNATWASGSVGRIPKSSLRPRAPQGEGLLLLSPKPSPDDPGKHSNNNNLPTASDYDSSAVYNMLMEKRRIASEPGTLVEVIQASAVGNNRSNRLGNGGGGGGGIASVNVPTYMLLKRFEEKRAGEGGSIPRKGMDPTADDELPFGSPQRLKRDAMEHVIDRDRERLADAALKDVLRGSERTGRGMPSVRHAHDDVVGRLERQSAAEMQSLHAEELDHHQHRSVSSSSGLPPGSSTNRPLSQQQRVSTSNNQTSPNTYNNSDATLTSQFNKKVLDDMAYRVTDPDLMVLGGFTGSYGLDYTPSVHAPSPRPLEKKPRGPTRTVSIGGVSTVVGGSSSNMKLMPLTSKPPNPPEGNDDGDDPLVALLSRAVKLRNQTLLPTGGGGDHPNNSMRVGSALSSPNRPRSGAGGGVGISAADGALGSETSEAIVSTIPKHTIRRLKVDFERLANEREPKGLLTIPELVQNIMRLDAMGVPHSSNEIEERIVRLGGIIQKEPSLRARQHQQPSSPGAAASTGITAIDFNGYVVVMLKLDLIY